VAFDENSMGALSHARRLAIDMEATIHLLHVLPILPRFPDQGGAIGIDETAEKDALRQLKDIARRRLSRVPTEIHTHLAFDSEVPKNILAFARELAPDLIVMATHGRGPIKHLLFGSVAEVVVRGAICPVLTLRFTAQSEPQPQAPADIKQRELRQRSLRQGIAGKPAGSQR
jgi:nucleotide-binding universal stress UspA family protein